MLPEVPAPRIIPALPAAAVAALLLLCGCGDSGGPCNGQERLCGLRLVHTHLYGESLSDDDLTDLALLRLDYVTAIEVLDTGLPGKVYSAHLLPENPEGKAWDILPPTTVHALEPDFWEVMDALEGPLAMTFQPAEPSADAGQRTPLDGVE